MNDDYVNDDVGGTTFFWAFNFFAESFWFPDSAYLSIFFHILITQKR